MEWQVREVTHLLDNPFLRIFGEAAVVNDWRWRVSVIAFLAIPFFGILKYVEHWQIQNSEVKTGVLEFGDSVQKDIGQFEISGFASEEVQVVQTLKHEYAVVNSADTDWRNNTAVILKRARSDSDSLNEKLATGAVSGLASSGQWISSERAMELGLAVPSWAPERLLYVDVDREYFSVITGVTAGYIVLGLIVLAVIYTKLDDQSSSRLNRRSNVNSQVALQLAIARHETYIR